VTEDIHESRHHTLITPEGLPLAVEIAPVGDRIQAFVTDFLLMGLLSVATAGVLTLAGLALGGDGAALFASLALLSSFLLWNGYFLYFELRWRGATPGKRWVGLKVVSRDGGPLTTGAVFSRNLLRSLEFYFLMQILLSPLAGPGSPSGWTVFLSCIWLFILLFMPLLNRDRARCGDLVAGTLVVVKPRVHLSSDLAEISWTKEDSEAFSFAQEQLEMYGIRELQVLEDILRRDPRSPDRRRLLCKVCEKITRKIDWKTEVPEVQVIPFLEAFYRAQRNRLEQRLLMGERRERKQWGRLGSVSRSKPPGKRRRRRK